MTIVKPTLFAARGLEFVAVFQVRFSSFNLSGHTPLLRDPPGESTGGGKLATQHIVLQPADPSASAWTAGSVNVATLTSKIRTFDCMRQIHRTRFGDRPFPLDGRQYHRFFDAAVALMKERGIAVEIENALPELRAEPAPLASPEAPPSRGRSSLVWVLIGALLVATAASAFFVLRGILTF